MVCDHWTVHTRTPHTASHINVTYYVRITSSTHVCHVWRFSHWSLFYYIRFFSSFCKKNNNKYVHCVHYVWLVIQHNRHLDTEKSKTVFFFPIKCPAQRDKRNKEKWKKNRNPWKNVSKTNPHIHLAASASNSKKNRTDSSVYYSRYTEPNLSIQMNEKKIYNEYRHAYDYYWISNGTA